MKKVISIAIVVILMIGLFSFMWSAQIKYTFGDYSILSYEGDETEIQLPTKDNHGKPVVRIEAKVFSGTDISKVYIPDGYR